MSNYLDEAFGERGYCAGASAMYAPRAGQRELTRRIDDAVARGCHLLAESPCCAGRAKGARHRGAA